MSKKSETAREAYMAHFRGNVFAAGEFEQATLCIGREFLPACAIAVLDGIVEPTAEYWAWLTEEAETAEREAAAERADEAS